MMSRENLTFQQERTQEGGREDSDPHVQLNAVEFLASPWVGLHYSNEYCPQKNV